MVWHRRQPGALSSPKLRRLTAGVNTSSVSMGCVGHTSVHSDRGSCAWGSGVCARRVEQQQQQHSTVFIQLCMNNRAAVQNLVLMAMDDL